MTDPAPPTITPFPLAPPTGRTAAQARANPQPGDVWAVADGSLTFRIDRVDGARLHYTTQYGATDTTLRIYPSEVYLGVATPPPPPAVPPPTHRAVLVEGEILVITNDGQPYEHTPDYRLFPKDGLALWDRQYDPAMQVRAVSNTPNAPGRSYLLVYYAEPGTFHATLRAWTDSSDGGTDPLVIYLDDPCPAPAVLWAYPTYDGRPAPADVPVPAPTPAPPVDPMAAWPALRHLRGLAYTHAPAGARLEIDAAVGRVVLGDYAGAIAALRSARFDLLGSDAYLVETVDAALAEVRAALVRGGGR